MYVLACFCFFCRLNTLLTGQSGFADGQCLRLYRAHFFCSHTHALDTRVLSRNLCYLTERKHIGAYASCTGQRTGAACLKMKTFPRIMTRVVAYTLILLRPPVSSLMPWKGMGLCASLPILLLYIRWRRFVGGIIPDRHKIKIHFSYFTLYFMLLLNVLVFVHSGQILQSCT